MDGKKTILVVATIVGAALVAPLLGIYPVFLMKVYCLALLACAFNLLLGYTGLLSFGHAAFFGSAAYVTAHAAKVWGWPPEAALAGGTVAAAALGLVFGGLAIRRQGIYFAMITLALSQMVFFLCAQAPFTHGEDGIQAVPRGRLFGILNLADTSTLYYVVFAITALGIASIHRTVHSPFGQILKAIRENESRAISLGYKVERYKLTAFVMSATLAGLAGSLKAIVFQLATLNDVHWHASGEVILMTLLGGMGTILGPAFGALLVASIQNYLANVGSWVTIIQGLIFIVVVLLFRKGIIGELQEWMSRRNSRPTTSPKDADDIS